MGLNIQFALQQCGIGERQVTYQGDPIVSSSLKFLIWFFSLSWAACVSDVSGTWRPCVHLSTFAGFWGVHLWGFFLLVFSRHHLLCLGSFASVSATVICIISLEIVWGLGPYLLLGRILGLLLSGTWEALANWGHLNLALVTVLFEADLQFLVRPVDFWLTLSKAATFGY